MLSPPGHSAQNLKPAPWKPVLYTVCFYNYFLSDLPLPLLRLTKLIANNEIKRFCVSAKQL